MSNTSDNTLYAPVVVEMLNQLNKQIEFYKSLVEARDAELKEVHQYLWDLNELYHKDIAKVKAIFRDSITEEFIDITFDCYIPLQHQPNNDYSGEIAAYRDFEERWEYVNKEAYNNFYKEYPLLLDNKDWKVVITEILNEDEFMSEEDINELYLGSPDDYQPNDNIDTKQHGTFKNDLRVEDIQVNLSKYYGK